MKIKHLLLVISLSLVVLCFAFGSRFAFRVAGINEENYYRIPTKQKTRETMEKHFGLPAHQRKIINEEGIRCIEAVWQGYDFTIYMEFDERGNLVYGGTH